MSHCRKLSSVLVLIFIALLKPEAHGEIIFQDFFNNFTGNNVSNSVPFIDVQGDGWQVPLAATSLALDDAGHLFDATTSSASASIILTPIGPHGCLTVTTTLQLPVNGANWIGMGFGNDNQSLASPESLSGPWLRVNNDGSIIFYGGINTNNPTVFPNTFTNSGSPVLFSLAYNAFHNSVTVTAINGGITNILLNDVAVPHSAGVIGARYLVFQFSATDVIQSNRWVGPVTVGWIPRPPPMLVLPVPTNAMVIFPVGAPTGGDDTKIIQDALSLAAATGQPSQIQFTAGATYLITNGIMPVRPLTLKRL